MAPREIVSLTGLIFVGKLQQLAISQTSFDPVITTLVCRLNVQESSLRSAAAGCNVFEIRRYKTLKQLEVIIGKNIGQKLECVAVGRSCLTELDYVCQGHEHTRCRGENSEVGAIDKYPERFMAQRKLSFNFHKFSTVTLLIKMATVMGFRALRNVHIQIIQLIVILTI
jgi:hypothetical protein